jgi:hypothetical protein
VACGSIHVDTYFGSRSDVDLNLHPCTIVWYDNRINTVDCFTDFICLELHTYRSEIKKGPLQHASINTIQFVTMNTAKGTRIEYWSRQNGVRHRTH